MTNFSLEEKEKIIAGYSGQKHEQMLEIIQKQFPPKIDDKRSHFYETEAKIENLKKTLFQLRKISDKLSNKEIEMLKKELSAFCESI